MEFYDKINEVIKQIGETRKELVSLSNYDRQYLYDAYEKDLITADYHMTMATRTLNALRMRVDS